jgi:small subunit ribosomal protein S21
MVKVQIRPNEPLEAALRRFKRQCNYAGVFRLSKKYAYYEKRSDKRRREERERIRNIQRAIRRTETKGKPRVIKKNAKGRFGRRPPRNEESEAVPAEASVLPGLR